MKHVADVDRVLLIERLVQAQLPAYLCFILGRAAFAEEGIRRGTGERVDEQEHDNREPHQDGDQKQQPSDDVSEHP